jgi:hypothetical protein
MWHNSSAGLQIILLSSITRSRRLIRARIKQFLAVHNREANRFGTGKYDLRSIDASAFAESSTTLGDTVSRGLWD